MGEIGVSQSAKFCIPNHVLANAGARLFTGGLDIVDQKIIDQIKSRTIRIIDRTSEVGGYAGYDFRNRQVVDTDNDGIPDWFESAHASLGYKVNEADDKLDYDNDGFTNIEEYANGLISGYEQTACTP